ncbi:hypothetical protein K435DRAFT_180472 [Dendrothele bispora CBS 962.96]|uniref:Uncharacterized protein n=1 Tax=Dendrothele bispora (strain CBS 962.96) TaxID=1314807 RepID=A0A4V4HF82_DENBC|nr:hypothetical protein K435DRAFT_180472 [Dendrothele bispora CBS 962.96]
MGNIKKEKDYTFQGFTGNLTRKATTANTFWFIYLKFSEPSILSPRTSSTLSTISKVFTLIRDSPELGRKKTGRGPI